MAQPQHRKDLLRLQQAIHRETGLADVPDGLDTLVFDAANTGWGIPTVAVARVLMPNKVLELPRYAQLPQCVIGVISGLGEMLTVVDGGLLLGGGPTRSSLKARLIVFADIGLTGYAMFVDRVGNRVNGNAPQMRGRHSLTVDALLSSLARLRQNTGNP